MTRKALSPFPSLLDPMSPPSATTSLTQKWCPMSLVRQSRCRAHAFHKVFWTRCDQTKDQLTMRCHSIAGTVRAFQTSNGVEQAVTAPTQDSFGLECCPCRPRPHRRNAIHGKFVLHEYILLRRIHACSTLTRRLTLTESIPQEEHGSTVWMQSRW